MKLLQKLKVWKNGGSESANHEGICAVKTACHSLAIEQIEKSARTFRVSGPSYAWTLSLALDGMKSKVLFDDVYNKQNIWSVDPGSEQAALSVYLGSKRDLAGAPTVSWGKKKVAVIALIFVAFVMVLQSNGSSSTPTPHPAPVLMPQLPPAPLVQSPSQVPPEANLSSAERSQIEGLTGKIVMRNAGTQFFVFTDPNCPFCKELEKSMQQLDAGLKPVILPLGYKPGSRDLASSILCSADPGTAWKKALLEGKTPTAKACDKGYAMVDENMRLFERLRLNSTPTMVTPTGVLVSGAATASEISTIMAR